jgi:hypothetical protein
LRERDGSGRDFASHRSTSSSLIFVSDYQQTLMAEQAEATFLKGFVGVIANQPVSYPDDFQAPPEQSLRRVPVVPVCFLALWTQQISVLPTSFTFW